MKTPRISLLSIYFSVSSLWKQWSHAPTALKAK